MDVLKDDLLEAVASVASPLLLSAFAGQIDDFGAVLTAEQAGGAIVAAICPERRFGHLGAKRLIGCEITHNGEEGWLTASECALHPGLSDWTPPCFAQAAMLPVETSYTMANATGPVPVFESVGVVTGEGLCSGQLAMTFASGARVIVYYGQRPVGGLFASASYAASGDGLFEIGSHLRRAANEASAIAVQAEQVERAMCAATFH